MMFEILFEIASALCGYHWYSLELHQLNYNQLAEGSKSSQKRPGTETFLAHYTYSEAGQL